MLRHYFKTAWRNLKKNKIFSVINISGLALGIACSLLIFLWINDERSTDNFHEHKKEIYQVYERNFSDGKVDANYATQGLLADELKRQISEIKYTSGFEKCTAPGTLSVFSSQDKNIKKDGYFASNDFFKMFSFPVIAGSRDNALNEPNTIAISKDMAIYFFQTPQNAVNKSVRLNNENDLKITAVFENIPGNSSLQFDFIRCWNDFIKENKWTSNWGNTDPQTFVQLNPGAASGQVESKIKDFVYRYQQKDKSFIMELGLQKFTDKYLHADFKNGRPDGGRIEYVSIFSIVAIFILIIACINFMNLATAQASGRSKEVGMRKVAGAYRSSLIIQFISEALVFTFFAVVIALSITTLALPYFNTLTGKHISLPVQDWKFWISIFLFMCITGIISGSYPAFYLSSFDPIKVLKGKTQFNGGAVFIRKGLVIFQFALSILLVAGMIVIYKQMDFIQTKNLGYDRENLLYIPIEGTMTKNYSTFKTEALKISGIVNVSKMRNSPTQIEHHVTGISWLGKPSGLTVPFADGVVGLDFVKTLHLKLQDGRDFSDSFGNDSTSYILNETAVNKIGWKNAVGKTITFGSHQGTVIGVLKDFHFNSLHQNIEPLILRLDENWPWGNILVRVQAAKTKNVINELGALYKKMNPAFPFTYQFSDEEFSKLYKSESVVSRLSDCFAFIAVFISCLGLFGLSAFSAAQRIKEIGVRKILGASVSDILVLLYGNFLKLICIAMLIAFPLAWIVMNNWLKDFAYRIDISIWYFVFAGAITLFIAFVTIGHQALKAARANPAKSLKTE